MNSDMHKEWVMNAQLHAQAETVQQKAAVTGSKQTIAVDKDYLKGLI